MPYRTWGTSRGRRLPARVYEKPRAIHVVIGTEGRRSFFERAALAELAFAPLVEHQLTIAACVLRDHVHWLLDDSREISASVGGYKSLVSARAREWGWAQRLWQRSFWDHVIRSAEKLDVVVRYVVENPIRAGLCQRYEDYPYVVVFPERIERLR